MSRKKEVVGLYLLPTEESQLTQQRGYSFDLIHLVSDHRIFGQFEEGKSMGIRSRARVRVQTHVSSTSELTLVLSAGEYNERKVRRGSMFFRFAYARDLKKLQLPANAKPKNLAVKAFINALPDETPVYLDWS